MHPALSAVPMLRPLTENAMDLHAVPLLTVAQKRTLLDAPARKYLDLAEYVISVSVHGVEAEGAVVREGGPGGGRVGGGGGGR